MVEVKVFRESFRAWLLAIDGMSAQVGTRVIYGWPQTPPTFPMATFTLSRTPLGDYPGHAWNATVELNLHAIDPDDLDAIEDLVLEWIADEDNDLNATLSSDGNTLVQGFALQEVGADEMTARPEDGSYGFGTRTLTFGGALVGLSEG